MILSIIIPAYNVEMYLSDCLESLVSNSFGLDPNLVEIIIVNDGSTDNTLNIALSFSNSFDFIKVYDKPNGGLSDARNYGIDKARGDYLSFIDSDDIIKNNFINDVLKVINTQKDVDVISFNVVKFYSEPVSFKENFKFYEVQQDFYCSKPLIACNKIYNQSLFESLRYPQGKFYEDVWTTPSIIYNSKKFVHIDNDYYGYRQRLGSITANVDSKYLDIIGALNVIASHTENNFIKNVFVSQFFTLIFLSLRLPLTEASRNISLVIDFFNNIQNIKPYKNRLYEEVMFHIFKVFKNKAKYIYLLCRPAVALHLYIKNHRG